MSNFYNAAQKVQDAALIALLIFTPLARGATPRWAFCLSAFLVLLSISAMLLKRLWAGQRLLPRSPLDLPVALWLVLAFASVFTSIYQTATIWALVRLCLYAGVFYLVFESTQDRKRTRRWILTVLAMSAALALIGLFKYFGGPVPSFWVYEVSSQDQFVTGTFLNHNHLAGYLEMALALGLGLLLNRSVADRWLLSWCLILVLFTLILTMSRGGWLGASVALVFMLILIFRKKKVAAFKIRLAGGALVLAVIVIVLGFTPVFERAMTVEDPQEPSLLGRLSVWSGTLELIRENPGQGTGLGTFPWSFTQVRPVGLHLRYREAHNDYLQLVSEMGLPVMIPIIWGLILVFKRGMKRFKRTVSRFTAGTSVGALGGLTAILIHSLTDFNIQITSNGILFSALVGLAMGAGTWNRKRSSSSPHSKNRPKIVEAI